MAETSTGSSFDTLSEFVSMAKGVVATGHDLDEANTKAKIVTPFIRTLGWRVYDNNEVLLEYSGEREFEDRADYALFGPEEVHTVVEAKQIGRNISEHGNQICRYMRLFGADWGILTNGERFLIYQATGENEESLMSSVSLANLPSNDYVQNLRRQSAYNESTISNRENRGSPRILEDSRERIESFVSEQRSGNQDKQPEDSFGPLYDSLIKSIAPSVYGWKSEKLALLLSLVGGVRKSVENGRSVRGAIHVLIVHDPGTMSADMVGSAAQFAPQSVRISGKTDAENLMRIQMDSSSSAPRKLSEYSIDTLSRASHAVVTEFSEINEEMFKRMQEGFDAGFPSDDPNCRNERERTTGMIATSKPKYGRFDQYEPIGEQIGLSPSLISQFDLLFTATDQPEKEKDRNLAEHLIQTNYKGELKARQQEDAKSEDVKEEIGPEINSELLWKHLTYAKYNIFPTMTEEAQSEIQEFYVNLRARGSDEDAAVPVTARKLEALVRLAEASARIRLSDAVEAEDASRAIDVVRYCLKDIGMDPETGEFDADMVETGTSKEQRDRIKDLLSLIQNIEDEYERGAPVDVILKRAEEAGMEKSKAEHEIEQMKQKGDVFEPQKDYLMST